MKKQGFKKFMAMAVSLCMILSMMAVAMPVSAAATNLYDIDFDNAADSDTSYTNEANSGYVFGYNSGASVLNPTRTLVMDAKKGNKALKLTSEDPNNSYALGLMSHQLPNGPATMMVNGETVWFELSFRYDAFGRTWLNFGEYPFEITADGDLYVGGLNGGFYNGVKVDNFKVELGEWYHLVVAVDNINKVGAESRFYAWANGQFLETYETPYHGATCTKNYASDANHCLFYTYSTDLTLDDFKIYTTSEAVKPDGVLCFDPTAVMAGTQVQSDLFEVGESTIGVPTKSKLAEVVSAISFDGTASFFDGNTKIEDMNVAATGKTMYVASTSGVGVKKYTLVDAGNIEIPEMDITTNYYDVDFDEATDNDNSWKNNASAYSFANTTIGHWPMSTTLVDDSVKGSKAINVKSPAGASSGQYGCIGTRETGFSSFVSDRVVWHELSFKFNNFTRTYINAGEYPLDISADGMLYIGGLNGNAMYPGSAVVQLEAGRWYHLVIAFDNINMYADTEARVYAWLNGEFIETNETPYHGATASKTSRPAAGQYFIASIVDSKSVDFCLDDVKMYTTSQPVVTDGNFCFTPEKKIAGAYITSDALRVENGVIYVSEDMTVAQAVAAISCDNTYNIFDGTTPVDKTSDAPAIGKVVYSQSDNNIGVLKYSFAKGSENDFAVTSAVLSINGENGSVADIKANDKIIASVNVTATTTSGVVIFAVYDGNDLIGCSIKNVNTPGEKITSDEITVRTADDGVAVYAFLWDGMDSIKPLTDSFAY